MGLVLLYVGIPDSVDSPRKALFPLSSGCGVERMEKGRKGREGTGVGNFFKIKKYEEKRRHVVCYYLY